MIWFFYLPFRYWYVFRNNYFWFFIQWIFQDYLRMLVRYHRFFSFCFYCIGFVWFVLSLVKKYYIKQFSLFAWTHVVLLIVVTQSYFIIQNIFQGKWNTKCRNIFRVLIGNTTPHVLLICQLKCHILFILFFLSVRC